MNRKLIKSFQYYMGLTLKSMPLRKANWLAFHWVSLSLFLMFTPALSAQPIDELASILQEESPILKALEQQYLAAAEQAPQVSQLPQPELGVGAFISPVETRLGAQQARFSIGQLFPWFGTLEGKAQLMQTRAQVQREQIGDKALALTYQLKAAYLQLYEFRQAQLILKRKQQLLERLRRLALSQIESGSGSGADVLRVELEVQSLEQEVRILQKQEERPLATINHLLKRPLQQAIQTPDTLAFATLAIHSDTLRQVLLTHHPRLRSLQLEQDVAQQAMIVNKMEGKPSFGLGADYILLGARSDADPSRNGRDIFQVSAKVSIPIYRKKYEAKEKEEGGYAAQIGS